MRKKRIKYDVAKNGEEAVHKWRSGAFHLILVSNVAAKLQRFLGAHENFRWIYRCP